MAKKTRGEILDPLNEVHKLQTFKEVVEWNKRYETYSGKYRVNPFFKSTVSAKPNQVDPRKAGSEKYVPSVYRDPTQEAFSSNYLKQTISLHKMTPNQKYRGPQTSAQEVGWFNKPVVRQSKSTFLHFRPKNSCYETFFATEYFKSSGDSPFKSNKKLIK